MRLCEYRVCLPMTVEEYQRGQLYSVAKASEKESNNSDRVEIVKNEPYEKENGEKGQYTFKIYHLKNRVPAIVRAILPSSLFRLEEESWNAYPHCKTVLRNQFLNKRFQICIESRHVDNDLGEQENVHGLDAAELKKREIVPIDFAADQLTGDDYIEEEDPSKVKSEKTGRGPLNPKNWKHVTKPLMCAYKLVTAEFKVFGLQKRIEKHIISFQNTLFNKFHRSVFAWIDEWVELSMADIRAIEAESKAKLEKQYGHLNKQANDAYSQEVEKSGDKDRKHLEEEASKDAAHDVTESDMNK